MDFSVDGSDFWDSTPAQDRFIQKYFKTKEPQNGTITKMSKMRKRHSLNTDRPLSNAISKQVQIIIKKKHSMNKSKQVPLAKELYELDESAKTRTNQNMTENNMDTNPTIKSSKKSKKVRYQLEVPNKIEKTNKFNKKSLETTTKTNALSGNDLEIVKSDSSKKCFNKDSICSKNDNLKRKKSCIIQASPKQSKSSVINASRKTKKAKKKITLNPKETRSNSDESSDNEGVNEVNCKIKKTKKSKSTLELEDICANLDESSNSDDDEVIRNELQDTPMFKKIQKLMRLAPHLNPNFDKDTETGNSSWEEISDENISSENDEESPENDEESSEDEVQLSKVPGNNFSKSCEDSPSKKKASNQSQTDLETKKSKKAVESSSPLEDNLKISKSQTSQDQLTLTSSSQGNLLLCREPSNSRASENSKRCSAMMNKARAKLASAKFRLLNEKLYTESGEEAFKYFQENREEFEDYHLGYGMQVAKWPLNPVDEIIKDLQKYKDKVVIADLGCGDAKIARVLTNKKVHSFDLVSTHECVTACNISRVPLPDGSVDVAVFCLSLMGVNLVDYLREAYRILKLGGCLKIAEVESRIENLDIFIASLKSLGFELERKNTKHKLFVFLDLKKAKKGKSSKATNFTLRPCLYKKR